MDYEAAREHMIESQLRPNRCTDPAVIDAVRRIPRELFVPKAKRSIAYVDEDIEVTPGRYLTEPMVLSRLVQDCMPGPDDVALVVGCGTGYGAAVLSRLVNTVFALEVDPDLAKQAGATFTSLGFDNILVVEGPLEQGWASEGPFNIILFDGGVERRSEVVESQLAEGGRMVGVFRDKSGVGRATLCGKYGQTISGRVLFDAEVGVLPGFEHRPEFVF